MPITVESYCLCLFLSQFLQLTEQWIKCYVQSAWGGGQYTEVVRQGHCLRDFHLLRRQTLWTKDDNAEGGKDKDQQLTKKMLPDTEQSNQFNQKLHRAQCKWTDRQIGGGVGGHKLFQALGTDLERQRYKKAHCDEEPLRKSLLQLIVVRDAINHSKSLIQKRIEHL